MADETLETPVESGGFWTSVILEIVQSPINILLVIVIAFLVYKIFKSRNKPVLEPGVIVPDLPKLRKDFTLEELREHDGYGREGRVLVAVNGNVYDCTRGKRFYGPGNFFYTLNLNISSVNYC